MKWAGTVSLILLFSYCSGPRSERQGQINPSASLAIQMEALSKGNLL